MTTNMIIAYVVLMAISAIIGWKMEHNRGTTLTLARLIANKYVAYTKDQITGNAELIEHPEAKDGW